MASPAKLVQVETVDESADIAGKSRPQTAAQVTPVHIVKALQQTSQAQPKAKHEFAIFISDDGKQFNTKERIVAGLNVWCRLLPGSVLIETTTEVPPPAANIPTDDEFFSKKRPGLPDVDFLKQHFFREGRIKEEHAILILHKATEIFKKESNVVEVEAPVTGNSLILWTPSIFG